MTSQQTILLTGASGVVGTALLPKLAGHRVISLVHKQVPPGASEHVRGDLAAPGLGLDPATARGLVAEVDVVVHCAAVTDFGAGATTTDELNVVGTAGVLDFARRADATVHYLSTAFVARNGMTRGRTNEGGADPADYLTSKLAAEQLVRDSGVAATIVRPSVVIGDSETGAISKFQGLHSLALAVLKGALPLLPLDQRAHIDFVPQDHLADALTALIDNNVRAGEYWVTAGEAALFTQAMIDIVTDEAVRIGLSLTPPRLVEPDMVDRLVRPVFIDPLPKGVRRRFDDMLAMTALFAGADFFPCSEIPGLEPLGEERLSEAFRRSVRYLAVEKGLARPGTEAA
ncbi:SDR family oxidoreductase [Lentzea sp. CA-135723]|uniref:SDR family oxidoreductase n=1 Tax=Lentzea sp. CA-135723 TaxID=3239950 RepID=UPI003D9183D8